jgi:hypothetical protein
MGRTAEERLQIFINRIYVNYYGFTLAHAVVEYAKFMREPKDFFEIWKILSEIRLVSKFNFCRFAECIHL